MEIQEAIKNNPDVWKEFCVNGGVICANSQTMRYAKPQIKEAMKVSSVFIQYIENDLIEYNQIMLIPKSIMDINTILPLAFSE